MISDSDRLHNHNRNAVYDRSGSRIYEMGGMNRGAASAEIDTPQPSRNKALNAARSSLPSRWGGEEWGTGFPFHSQLGVWGSSCFIPTVLLSCWKHLETHPLCCWLVLFQIFWSDGWWEWGSMMRKMGWQVDEEVNPDWTRFIMLLGLFFVRFLFNFSVCPMW